MDSSPKPKKLKLSLSDEDLRCPMCCEIFQTPKLLPMCAHSFCEACLMKMADYNKNQTLLCPVCRKPSSIPDNGPKGLATNNLILRLIEAAPNLREKEEINEILSECKKAFALARKEKDDIEEQMNLLKKNVEKAGKVKEEISLHAEEILTLVKKRKDSLNSEVISL